MKTLSILSLAVSGTLFTLASACAYGWISEMAYTEVRLNSMDLANEAMNRQEADSSHYIIRPPADDPSFYK